VQEVKQLQKYDPEQAKQLLAAAGFPSGIELELIEPTTKYGQQFVTQVQLLQSQVKKAGITLKLKPVTDTEDSQAKRAGTFQLDLDPNTTKAGDPDGSLYPLFNSASTTTNYLRVRDPKLDALLDAQRRRWTPQGAGSSFARRCAISTTTPTGSACTTIPSTARRRRS